LNQSHKLPGTLCEILDPITVDNKTAEDAFRFPTGSIIVREKIVAKDKSDVKSLAVMIKRERTRVYTPMHGGARSWAI
jgi:hypothetical protein